MMFLKILEQIKTLIRSHTGVEMAFGQPTQVGDMTVVPVARISFGLGGGGGKGGSKPAKKEDIASEGKEDDTPSPAVNSEDEGGGGGGGLRTEPIGIYTIRGDKVRFHPVIAFSDLVKVLAIASVLIWRLTKRKKAKLDKNK